MNTLSFLLSPSKELIPSLENTDFVGVNPNNREQEAKSYQQLCTNLSVGHISPFAWSQESIYGLLVPHLLAHRKLALVQSCNYFCKEVFVTLQKHYPKEVFLILPNEKGMIEESLLLELRREGFTIFFIPYLNEDILTSNAHLSQTFQQDCFRECMIIWDCSYGLALGEALPYGNYFMVWGVPFGLPDFWGFLAHSTHKLTNPTKKGFFSLWDTVISQRKTLSFYPAKDFLEILCKECQHFGKEFLPKPFFSPHLSPKNALALRFEGIRASELIGSLALSGILATNGIECHFGLSKPSFVLQAMGFSDAHSRELLSISLGNADYKKTAQKLAQSYCIMRQLNVRNTL